MTDYERGRRDAIRDVIVHLAFRSGEMSEETRRVIARECESIEQLTAVEPEGKGRVWR